MFLTCCKLFCVLIVFFMRVSIIIMESVVIIIVSCDTSFAFFHRDPHLVCVIPGGWGCGMKKIDVLFLQSVKTFGKIKTLKTRKKVTIFGAGLWLQPLISSWGRRSMCSSGRAILFHQKIESVFFQINKNCRKKYSIQFWTWTIPNPKLYSISSSH